MEDQRKSRKVDQRAIWSFRMILPTVQRLIVAQALDFQAEYSNGKKSSVTERVPITITRGLRSINFDWTW